MLCRVSLNITKLVFKNVQRQLRVQFSLESILFFAEIFETPRCQFSTEMSDLCYLRKPPLPDVDLAMLCEPLVVRKKLYFHMIFCH